MARGDIAVFARQKAAVRYLMPSPITRFLQLFTPSLPWRAYPLQLFVTTFYGAVRAPRIWNFEVADPASRILWVKELKQCTFKE